MPALLWRPSYHSARGEFFSCSNTRTPTWTVYGCPQVRYRLATKPSTSFVMTVKNRSARCCIWGNILFNDGKAPGNSPFNTVQPSNSLSAIKFLEVNSPPSSGQPFGRLLTIASMVFPDDRHSVWSFVGHRFLLGRQTYDYHVLMTSSPLAWPLGVLRTYSHQQSIVNVFPGSPDFLHLGLSMWSV